MKKKLLTSVLLCAVCTGALADEGMWMVNAISQALVQKMQAKGCTLDGNDIYDINSVSLKDAIVSLDFGCTGSIVSNSGLLITNHHCAYGDVHALSTAEHNYLEDGFYAHSPAEEIPITGKCVQFLQKMIDVTDEVNAYIEEQKAAGKPFGMRRLSYVIEKKYKEQTGLEASLSSMWAGSRYYLALYKEYTDVRLVAAPPVSIAAFGGDVDNWEWPQHKCDFALYRVYAGADNEPAPYSEANVPLKPVKRLRMSTAGYGEGDFTMIMGYPGRTDRYASSAKVQHLQNVTLPISNRLRGEQMQIISRWMDTDPAIRLKYSDRFFSLSNVQELQSGEVECFKRFKTIKEKKRLERRSGDKQLKATAAELTRKYAAIARAEKNRTYYRETLVRGTRMSIIATKLKNRGKTNFNYDTEYAGIDMRVEKELFAHAVKNYFENVDSSLWGPYQVKVRERFRGNDGVCDLAKLAEYLWQDDYAVAEDPICLFLNDVSIADFNHNVDDIQGEPNVSELGKQYTRQLYKARERASVLQYPDANSTMRMTFGTVGTFKRDGVRLPWQTFSDQILAKEDKTSYDFTLKDDWRAMLQSATPVPVNFISDNDITGGNSGSPVLNARGELIGLAFDGNKESLAGDCSWTEGYNKCVCVDIRFVLWTLEHHAGLKYILDEINE